MNTSSPFVVSLALLLSGIAVAEPFSGRETPQSVYRAQRNYEAARRAGRLASNPDPIHVESTVVREVERRPAPDPIVSPQNPSRTVRVDWLQGNFTAVLNDIEFNNSNTSKDYISNSSETDGLGNVYALTYKCNVRLREVKQGSQTFTNNATVSAPTIRQDWLSSAEIDTQMRNLRSHFDSAIVQYRQQWETDRQTELLKPLGNNPVEEGNRVVQKYNQLWQNFQAAIPRIQAALDSLERRMQRNGAATIYDFSSQDPLVRNITCRETLAPAWGVMTGGLDYTVGGIEREFALPSSNASISSSQYPRLLSLYDTFGTTTSGQPRLNFRLNQFYNVTREH